ncbi:hypothetical protein Tco_0833072 [Tanacetum coccineum]
MEITPNLAMRDIETPLSSPKGRMRCLCIPTPSGEQRSSSCEFVDGPTQHLVCMEIHRERLLLINVTSLRTKQEDARLSKFEADFKQQQGEMTNKIDIVLKAITDRITGALPSDTIKNPKLNVNSTSSVSKYDDSHEEELREDENTARRGVEVEYFNTFPTRIELAYHKSGVKFIDGSNEMSIRCSYKIENTDSLLDLEKEHTKWVYLRNEEDKRRGVKYVMNKILVFYKECLELGPEYLTGVADERGVTKLYLMRRSLEVLRKFQEDDSWRTI